MWWNRLFQRVHVEISDTLPCPMQMFGSAYTHLHQIDAHSPTLAGLDEAEQTVVAAIESSWGSVVCCSWGEMSAE